MTSDKGIKLNLDELGKVLVTARDLKKLSKEEIRRFKEVPLNKWAQEAHILKEQAALEMTSDPQAEFINIKDRHPRIQKQASSCRRHSALTENCFQ